MQGLCLCEQCVELLLDLVLVRHKSFAVSTDLEVLAPVGVVVAHRVVVLVVCALFAAAEHHTCRVVRVGCRLELLLER